MRYIAIGVLLLASAGTLSAQIHYAPTVDQCRANQAIWATELQSPGGKNRETFSVLVGRLKEMTDCYSMDSKEQSSPINGYLFLNSFIVHILSERQSRFIARHGLVGQFQTEDEAGIR